MEVRNFFDIIYFIIMIYRILPYLILKEYV